MVEIFCNFFVTCAYGYVLGCVVERMFNMAVTFDSNALRAYTNSIGKIDDENAIINKSGDGITTNGTYTGALSALNRSAATKAENNEARMQLLQSLGKAFGLGEGVRNEKGKVTFSPEFMRRLEGHLGKDFKVADFGINQHGEVASGKPLTQRRVEAIVNKAYRASGVFSREFYQNKFEAILKQVAISACELTDRVVLSKNMYDFNRETLLKLLYNALDLLRMCEDGLCKVSGEKTEEADTRRVTHIYDASDKEWIAIEDDQYDVKLGELIDLQINAVLGMRVQTKAESPRNDENPVDVCLARNEQCMRDLQSFVMLAIDKITAAKSLDAGVDAVTQMINNTEVFSLDAVVQCLANKA